MTAPVLDQATIDAITIGVGGKEGPGGGADNNGPSGFAAAVHQL
jgi:hypothetical protein